MAERLSLIIFGATGFTGKYAVKEMHRISKKEKNITWAIAGRSQSKLDKILKDLQSETGDDLTKIKIIIADVGNMDSLKEMSKQAKVVVNCCGPYRSYGESVVKACIETKTSHVDVSGEPSYMEKMQLAYNEAAKKAGVYIVSACGFDSIPTDLGVVFTEQSFKGTVNSIESYLKTSINSNYNGSGSAVLNHGTWESLIHEIGEQKEVTLRHRQLYPEKLPKQLPKLKSRSIIHKNDDANLWCLPFIGPDKSVVYRSQRFLYESEKKRPVQLNTYIGFGKFFTPLILSFYSAFLFIMAQFKCGRSLLIKYPRFFSFGYISLEGPSEDIMKNTEFSVSFYAKGWDEKDGDIDGKPPTKEIKTKVTGTNPAYGATCTTLIYSGITIVKESDKMPEKGGVLAPGAAFFKTSLIKNLNENGVTFEIIN